MGEKIKITVGEIRELYFEYLDALRFLNALDEGIFTLTYTEYQEMPELTMNILALYKSEKQKLINEKAH